MSEEYNGWSNRETWATALHINNDQGLYETAKDYTITAVEHHPSTEDGSGQNEAIYCLADTLENFVTELLDADWDGVKSMRYDIGSLWRVNWQEIADSFISEMLVK